MLLTLPWRESHEQPLQPARDPERAYFSSLHIHHKVRSRGTCEVLFLSVLLICPFFNCGRLDHVPVPVLKGFPSGRALCRIIPMNRGRRFLIFRLPLLFYLALIFYIRSGPVTSPILKSFYGY